MADIVKTPGRRPNGDKKFMNATRGGSKRINRKDSAGIDRFLANIRTGHFEKTLSALAAVGAAVTTGEIYLSHDSASFGNKMMWVPVFVMPTIIPAGIAGVFSKRAAKTVLPVASAVVVLNGLQGTSLHVRGISQKPGGPRAASRLYHAEPG